MKDSERAAGLSESQGLETGLHINLILPYDAPLLSQGLRESQDSIARYLQSWKWAQVIFNPFIRKAVALTFHAQVDEYRRLFQKEPAHFNGHKHMHLCMNMILSRLIPSGSAVRRSFTFSLGEKGLVNWLYRRGVDSRLKRNYLTTDTFFSIDPVSDLSRLGRIIDRARASSVELMVHPWRTDQRAFLRSDIFRNLIGDVNRGGFKALIPR